MFVIFNLLKGYRKFEWSVECKEAFQALKENLSQPIVLSKPVEGETLYIYIAITNVASRAILVRLEDTVQKIIYYVRKRLVDTESRYPAI